MTQNHAVALSNPRSRCGVWPALWALAVVMSLAGRVEARGDDAAEARKHAQRASNLAASGKCRQAVAEWNKAMAILRDPALLFNRAECYRKLGEADAALEDYRQFLSDLPKAPNRGEVEKRIAELSAQKDKEKGKEKEKDKAIVAPPPPPVVFAPSPVPAPTGPVMAMPAPEQGRPPSLLPIPEAAPPLRPVVPPAPPAPSEAAPNPGLALNAPAEPAAPAASAEGGITTRPWFWITIAAVAVAAGVGTFIVLSRDSTNIPSTALGNYKF